MTRQRSSIPPSRRSQDNTSPRMHAAQRSFFVQRVCFGIDCTGCTFSLMPRRAGTLLCGKAACRNTAAALRPASRRANTRHADCVMIRLMGNSFRFFEKTEAKNFQSFAALKPRFSDAASGASRALRSNGFWATFIKKSRSLRLAQLLLKATSPDSIFSFISVPQSSERNFAFLRNAASAACFRRKRA